MNPVPEKSPRPDEDARRQSWIEYMDRSHALFTAMLKYPVAECGERFASIPDAAQAAGVEMHFSETKIAGQFERIFFIREGLIEDLIAIGRDMNARGWILKIEEGFRTKEMQTALGRNPAVFDRIIAMLQWENHGAPPPLELVNKRLTCLVANYPVSGTHMSGAAVDISVIHRDDRAEVWRGAPYLTMSEVTPMDSPFVSAADQQNRRAITQIMERHGFLHYPGEFWHYNKGDALYQFMMKSGKPGRYGPVHWDARTNSVTPYDDYFAPLTPPELLRQSVAEALERLKQP
jgi:D-alanyl-D-alanine dipeptidase